MQLPEAFRTIKEFWREPAWPFGQGTNPQEIARISQEFSYELPPTLREYLAVAPAQNVLFNTVGNPMEVYGLRKLQYRQDGYNFNSVTNQEIPDWPAHWFMLADEGADPVIIDLQAPETGVRKLYHGGGDWDEGEDIADSIGQFLLCSAALHHALRHFTNDPIIDDASGFNLAPEPAAWLFPRIKQWAPTHYEAWCSTFENS
jgi:cell wall assembly regulator SMI1